MLVMLSLCLSNSILAKSLAVKTLQKVALFAFTNVRVNIFFISLKFKGTL